MLALQDRHRRHGALRLSSEGALSSAQTRIRDYRGLAVSFGVFGCLFYIFGLITGPATLYYAGKGFRQSRQLGDRGGYLSLIIAIFLGLSQIASSIAILWAIVSEMGK